ncbi:hypothetical protein B0H11DRAFT_2277642 [Mycena galericulata]|nr:hypothetical protein B0H11DRAFT_2277642 [Mycena galericulata]
MSLFFPQPHSGSAGSFESEVKYQILEMLVRLVCEELSMPLTSSGTANHSGRPRRSFFWHIRNYYLAGALGTPSPAYADAPTFGSVMTGDDEPAARLGRREQQRNPFEGLGLRVGLAYVSQPQQQAQAQKEARIPQQRTISGVYMLGIYAGGWASAWLATSQRARTRAEGLWD